MKFFKLFFTFLLIFVPSRRYETASSCLGYKYFSSCNLIILVFLFTSYSLTSEKNVLFEFAKKHYLLGELGQVEEKVNLIFEKNPKDPGANLIKGLLLLSEGGLANRLEARNIIESNSKKLKNDPFAFYALGLVNKAGNFNRQARINFENAIKTDSSFVDAYIELAEGRYKDMLRYYYRITDTTVPISFREYAIDDYDVAVYYIDRALKHSPYHKKAFYLLGNLYYEMEEFDKMRKLFQSGLENQPENKDYNLFMGLANLALHKYNESEKYFDLALDKMSQDEKNMFTNPNYLLKNPENKAQTETQKSIYWSAKDPMFLTEENERLLEHQGRIAYANMRYGVPKLQIEGWQTDRGKTYIRYGKPDYIVEYAKSMDWNVIYPPSQIWDYSRFQLMFSDEFWNGHFQYTQPFLGSKTIFKERTTINFDLVASNVFQEIPEIFDLELEGGSFDSPFQLLFFRGEDKNTEALLSYGLPLEEEIYEDSIDYLAGLFFLDEDKLPDFRLKDSLRIDFAKPQNRHVGNYYINNTTFTFPHGNYDYSFEILNKTEAKSFVHRGNLDIPDFSLDSLTISDILLAHHISPKTAGDQFNRNGLDILPNVSREYFLSDTVLIYFEIYNLFSPTTGSVDYSVENSITKLRKKGLLTSIFGNKKQSVSFVNEYSTRNRTEYLVQSVDISNMTHGEYVVEIKVRNKLTQEETLKSTKFRIMEHLIN